MMENNDSLNLTASQMALWPSATTVDGGERPSDGCRSLRRRGETDRFAVGLVEAQRRGVGRIRTTCGEGECKYRLNPCRS